jgi:hypothetical protein
MKIEDFKALIEARALIRFTKNIEDCEGYADAGMMARLDRLGKIDQDGSLSFFVDFKGLDDVNIPLEQSNYYNASGKPTLNARQAGFYSQKESYWAENLDKLDSLFTVADPRVEMLLEAYRDEKNEGETYQDWLVSQALPMTGTYQHWYNDVDNFLIFTNVDTRETIRESFSFMRKMGLEELHVSCNSIEILLKKDTKMEEALILLTSAALNQLRGF